MEVERAYEKTFLWLFEPNLGFRDWLRGVIIDPPYWIQGKPESGKSTAMKFALRHPDTLVYSKRMIRSPGLLPDTFSMIAEKLSRNQSEGSLESCCIRS
jgi:hypothetical protein